MSDVIAIPSGERGKIRVFALDMPPEQARFLKEPGALAQVLGIDDIDLEHVEIFPIADLEEIGLAGYLTDGCDVAPDQVEDTRDALEALEGYVLLIRSSAFAGTETRLTPAKPLILIGTYTERPTDWSAQPLETQSAKPFSSPRASPREIRNRAQRIGFTIFAVVMSLIVLLIVSLVT